MIDKEIDRKVRLWEQHGQTIMLAVITAALAFAAKTMWDANALQATMVAKIEALSSQLARLESSMSEMQAQYITRSEFNGHEQRLQRLESDAERRR